MSTKENIDGTIDVRVVLTVRVDPKEWAADMMGTHPDEVLQKEVRRDVKRYVRSLAANGTPSAQTYFRDVRAEGIYDGPAPVTGVADLGRC